MLLSLLLGILISSLVAEDSSLAENDSITYWTEYAVVPKQCIQSDTVDTIVFSMYDKAFHHCTDTPIGTYMVPISTFVQAYVDQQEYNREEMGTIDNDKHFNPLHYIHCYPFVTEHEKHYYAQLSCTDSDTQLLSLQLYSDRTCETPMLDEVAYIERDRLFDLDFMDVQIPFAKCISCVIFVDTNEDDVDDLYFERKKKIAPLCSKIWRDKSVCDQRCHGQLGNTDSAWNGVWGAAMGLIIVGIAYMAWCRFSGKFRAEGGSLNGEIELLGWRPLDASSDEEEDNEDESSNSDGDDRFMDWTEQKLIEKEKGNY